MGLRTLIATLVLLLAPLPAKAQPIFSNPFADAAAYRGQRGELSEARYRVHYEETMVERGGAPVVSELTIDVAPDWALVRRGDRVSLHDYRLNRVFLTNAGSFTTTNGLGDLVFRVMERQNRSYLQRLLAAAGPEAAFADACDAEAELGLAFPNAPDAAETELRERRDSVTLHCAGREIGSFTAGTDAAPPTAFWPTMFAVMTVHPALHARVRASGHAPARMEISYRQTPEGISRRSWRLIAIETVAVAYPLDATLRNATADTLDTLISPGAGQVASDAVAGRAQGGAPTLQTWAEHLRTLPREEAAMLILPSFNMFPELESSCRNRQAHHVCDLAHDLRTIGTRDPAPLALIEIGAAEQANNMNMAIAAMQRSQTSPRRDHPALGASFALALLKFNQENLAAARAANLPTDVAALQNRALLALPYNPAYWTDVGDRFGRNYEWPTAFLFYDAAHALPMPSAVSSNRALVGKRSQMDRIRADFPAAWSLTP
jgi:hypothetical protein